MYKVKCIKTTSWGQNRIDAFGLGPDGGIYHSFWDAIQENWGPVAGPELISGGKTTFASAPEAVCWAQDRIDIFCIGNDFQMYHLYWDLNGGGWGPTTGPEPLGQQFLSAPAAASWGAGRLDVFAVGGDSRMYHRYWDDTLGGWKPIGTWEPMGDRNFQYLTFAPAAVSWGPGRLDVFAVGTDGRMYRRYLDPGANGWQPQPDWEPWGGLCTSSPAVASWGPGRLDVFCLSSDSQMYHKYVDQSD